MSLVDEAREVRDRINARLRELEPLVREYEELRQIGAEMGLSDSDVAPPSGQTGRPRSSPQRADRSLNRSARPMSERERPSSTAAEGELARRVLDAVRAEPGKTVGDYAVILNLAATSLYRPVRQLTNDGVLVKRARQLFPA